MQALVGALIGAQEWVDALEVCEAGSDALGHAPEWLGRAVPLYTMVRKYLPPGETQDKVSMHSCHRWRVCARLLLVACVLLCLT
jgi:hypothetical protein